MPGGNRKMLLSATLPVKGYRIVLLSVSLLLGVTGWCSHL
jgi:hypothetical protein